MRRIQMMNCAMHNVTMDDTVDTIMRRIENDQFTQHVVVNVAKLVNMHSDPELAASVKHCDIVNIDGMGVVWAARLLGHQVPERVTGVDLFHTLNRNAADEGHSVYYLGASQRVVETAVAKMQQTYPGLEVAGYHHGYFWDDERAVVEAIRRSGAKMLFVAITSPFKERFIQRWKEQLGVQFVMGVGGTFDIIAGKTKRAPIWMQNSGLEWLYRVGQEPGRMWRRYLTTNSKFGWMLAVEMFKQRFSPTPSTPSPREE